MQSLARQHADGEIYVEEVDLHSHAVLRTIVKESPQWTYTDSWSDYDWSRFHVRLDPPDFVDDRKLIEIKDTLIKKGAVSVRVVPRQKLVITNHQSDAKRGSITPRQASSEIIDEMEHYSRKDDLRELVGRYLSMAGV